MTTTNQHAQRGAVSPEEWAFVCVVIEALSKPPGAPPAILMLKTMLESGLTDCSCPLDHHTADCAAHQRRKDVIDTAERILLRLIRGTGHHTRGRP